MYNLLKIRIIIHVTIYWYTAGQQHFAVDTAVLLFCVRIGCESIVRRIDEIKFLQIDISIYCTVLTLHSCCVFVMYLDMQGESCCLTVAGLTVDNIKENNYRELHNIRMATVKRNSYKISRNLTLVISMLSMYRQLYSLTLHDFMLNMSKIYVTLHLLYSVQFV